MKGRCSEWTLEGMSIVTWTVSGLLPPVLVTLRMLQWGKRRWSLGH